MSGTYGPPSATATIVGETPAAPAGFAFMGMGDHDGDGFGDLVVGVSEDDEAGEEAGAVYLFEGPLVGEIAMSAAVAKFTGNQVQDRVGQQVDAIGDVNGDGFDDLLAQGEFFEGRGMAFVAFGPLAGTRPVTEADILIRGIPYVESRFGQGIAGAGDLDGDGQPDLVVGGPELGAGAAYVFHAGLRPGTWTSEDADAWLVGEVNEAGRVRTGYANGSGEIDGDGRRDLVVAAPWFDGHSGAVYQVLGPFLGEMPLALVATGSVKEETPGEGLLGHSVAAPDVDGDGRADPTLTSENPNAVLVFANGLVGDLHPGAATARILSQFASVQELRSVGDLDADGHDDVLVACGVISTLFYGPISGTLGQDQADATFAGRSSDAIVRMGDAAAGAGDIDADGLPEVAIGSRTADDRSGAIYLF